MSIYSIQVLITTNTAYHKRSLVILHDYLSPLRGHSTFSVEIFNNFHRSDKLIKIYFLTSEFFWHIFKDFKYNKFFKNIVINNFIKEFFIASRRMFQEYLFTGVHHYGSLVRLKKYLKKLFERLWLWPQHRIILFCLSKNSQNGGPTKLVGSKLALFFMNTTLKIGEKINLSSSFDSILGLLLYRIT